jgi:hypothetical protein
MLYPKKKNEPLAPNAGLQQALDDAIAVTPGASAQAAIAIVPLVDGGPPYPFAERRGREVHYSASVLKLAAAYAVYELGRAGHDLIEEKRPAAADAVDLLYELDPEIRETKLPQLAANLDEKYLLPDYVKLFEYDPGAANINIAAGARANLEKAIGDVSNQDAAECVHGVGFGYLTRVMAEAGFLDPASLESPATADGIWLGGDFGFGYPAQRVPSVNDGAVAQAMSARQMARMMALLQGDELIVQSHGEGSHQAANKQLRQLVEQPIENGNHLLTKGTGVNGYTTRQSVMGYGPLKTGALVASEALVVEDKAGRLFVVVFQNVPYDQNPASLVPTARIVEQTIAAFA